MMFASATDMIRRGGELLIRAVQDLAITRPSTDVGLCRCLCCTKKVRPDEGTTFPCGHVYCRDDLTQLYLNVMQDHSKFPVQCCGTQLDSQIVESVLPGRICDLYDLVRVMKEDKNPTHCHDCGNYLKPPAGGEKDVQFFRHCPWCWAATCIFCGRKGHGKDDCPLPSAERMREEILSQQAFDKLARSCGWFRCFGCRAMISRGGGCSHVICRCGVEFCSLCGKRWKTCYCGEYPPEVWFTD